MPITAENFEKAQSILDAAKAGHKISPDKLAKLQADMDAFNQSYSPPTESYQPANTAVGGYQYEPSEEDFRSAFKNRDLRAQLGYGDEYGEESVGQSTVRDAIPGLAPKRSIEKLDKNSDEYKAYAQYAWEQAQKKDPSLKRYEDLSLLKNPFHKTIGAAVSLPAAAIGADKTLTGGIGKRSAIKMAGQGSRHAGASQTFVSPGEGTAEPQRNEARSQALENTLDTIERVSPGGVTAGQVGAYLAPFAPANIAARAIPEALGYEAAGGLTKAAIGGLTGGTVSAGEGAVQDVAENPEISGSEMFSRFLPRFGTGALMGSAGDLLSQATGKVAKSIQQDPRMRPGKMLKEGGGGFHFVKGVEAPTSVHENIAKGNVLGDPAWPTAIAANKVAPELQKSVTSQEHSAYKQVSDEIEAYKKSPEGKRKISAKPIVKNILDMFRSGSFEGPVTGDILHANQSAVKTFKEALTASSEVAHMNPGEAALYAQHNDGFILDSKTMKGLGIPVEQGKVAVMVPVKHDAGSLLALEDMIDDKLKMAGTPGGINDPIWKNINKATKEVRDQFGIHNPEFMDPGNPFYKASDVPAEPRVELDMPEEVGVNLPKHEAIPGIGGPQKGLSAKKPGGMYAIQPERPVVINDANSVRSSYVPGESEIGTLPPSALPSNPPIPDTIPPRDTQQIYRDPTPSQYQQGNVSMPQRRGMQAEEEAYRRQVDWDSNMSAQRRDADRMTRLREGEFVGNKPAESSNALTDEQQATEAAKKERTAKRKEAYMEAAGPATAPVGKRAQAAKAAETAKEPNQFEGQFDTPAFEVNTPSRGNEMPNMGEESAKRAYEPGEAIPNAGTFKLDDVVHEINQSGGVDRAGKLNRGMRPQSSAKEAALYAGKTPEEATKIASNLEYPIDISVDNGNVMVRDGRHRLDEAKKAGATHIKARIRKFNKRGQAEEVGIVALEINPKQQGKFEETLDDGTKVSGLSALRHRQHKALEAVNKTKQGTGAGSDKIALNKVLRYGTSPDGYHDDIEVLNEAKKLGLDQQLREVGATNVYPGMHERAWFGSSGGIGNKFIDVLGMRGIPLMEAISGAERNPFRAVPTSPAGRIQEYLYRTAPSELLNQRAGLGGARFGNEVADSDTVKQFREQMEQNDY